MKKFNSLMLNSYASPKEVGKKRRPDDRAPLRGVPVPSTPEAGRG
jgi:hypothetical protein